MLYHSLGVKGFTLIKSEFDKRGSIFHIEPQKRLYICPVCGSTKVSTRGYVDRTIKTIPFGAREETFLAVKIPKLDCKDCGTLRQMKLPFADERKSYTKQLASFIITLSAIASMNDIALLLKIGWAIVKEVIKSKLTQEYGNIDLSNITMISIDELSTHKRHKYVTVVIDVLSGRPLFVGEGKGEEALEPFWKALGPRRRKKILAVAIDMGRAYISAVSKNLPKAKIVFDHFHVIKLVNDVLNKLRIEAYKKASKQDKKVIAGTKFLLLSNNEDIEKDSKKLTRLQALLALNSTLSAAYILKEDLRQIWSKPKKFLAKMALAKWIETARSSEVPLLMDLADTIERHSEGLLNWYDFQINSGIIEGINKKSKS
jgi:transposase